MFDVELLYSTPLSSNKGVGGFLWDPSYTLNRLSQNGRMVYVKTTIPAAVGIEPNGVGSAGLQARVASRPEQSIDMYFWRHSKKNKSRIETTIRVEPPWILPSLSSLPSWTQGCVYKRLG